MIPDVGSSLKYAYIYIIIYIYIYTYTCSYTHIDTCKCFFTLGIESTAQSCTVNWSIGTYWDHAKVVSPCCLLVKPHSLVGYIYHKAKWLELYILSYWPVPLPYVSWVFLENFRATRKAGWWCSCSCWIPALRDWRSAKTWAFWTMAKQGEIIYTWQVQIWICLSRYIRLFLMQRCIHICICVYTHTIFICIISIYLHIYIYIYTKYVFYMCIYIYIEIWAFREDQRLQTFVSKKIWPRIWWNVGPQLSHCSIIASAWCLEILTREPPPVFFLAGW